MECTIFSTVGSLASLIPAIANLGSPDGHMLQLRQCKLAFPSVHLLVGVCSDELVRTYKASPVLSSAERYESVRHCKWVDEVVEDAPWTVDQAFIEKHQIDYIAHDEEPYVSAGSDDVYAFAKSIGEFTSAPSLRLRLTFAASQASSSQQGVPTESRPRNSCSAVCSLSVFTRGLSLIPPPYPVVEGYREGLVSLPSSL